MYGECILLLEKGTYEYTLSHPDYLNVTKRISVGTSASIETSYTSSLITFTVKNEFGSPIQGAILQYDEREVVSDENGICEIMSDSGKYEYIIIANQYISNTGESNISLGRNYSYNITLNIDVFKFKPEENRNIQMLVVAPKVTLTIKSTTVDYIVIGVMKLLLSLQEQGAYLIHTLTRIVACIKLKLVIVQKSLLP